MFGAFKRASFLEAGSNYESNHVGKACKARNMNGWALFRTVLYCLPQKFGFIRKKCSRKNSFIASIRGDSDNVFIKKVDVCSKCRVLFCLDEGKNVLLNINNEISSSRCLSLCALELVCLDKILERISEELTEDFLDY